MVLFKAGDSCYIKVSGVTKYAGTVAHAHPGTKTALNPEYYEVVVRQEYRKDDKGVWGWHSVNEQRKEYDAENVIETPERNVAKFTGGS